MDSGSTSLLRPWYFRAVNPVLSHAMAVKFIFRLAPIVTCCSKFSLFLSFYFNGLPLDDRT